MEPFVPTFGVPPAVLAAAAFVMGACAGSFLNVVIARVPFGRSVVWPPSHCGSCGLRIPAHHNLPIVSWFVLKGRCAHCLSRFSLRYPAIEFFFALVCLFAVVRHGLSLPAAREVVMVGFLVCLAAIDLDWWILPGGLAWGGAVAGLALAAAEGLDALLWRLLAAAVGYTALLLVGFVAERLMKREALGAGDPPLMALIGAFVGLTGLLPVILLASVQGTLIGGAMILLRRRRGAAPQPQPLATAEGEEQWTPDPTAVPFGPFLALGAAEVLYFPRISEVLFPYADLFR